MQLRYFLIVLVAFRMFVPMRYVVYMLGFFRLWFYFFCSNVFGSLIFVASLNVFRATWSIRFFAFLSIAACPCVLLWRRIRILEVLRQLWFQFCFLSPDGYFDRCKSCIISAGRGGFVRFFLFKHACFALSQFKLLGELLVATFERGVLFFRPCVPQTVNIL